MNRCKSLTMAVLLVAGISAGLLALPAGAQTEEVKPNVRQFPKNIIRGQIQVQVTPEVLMDNKADRMSPAVRIRDINNNLVLPGTLTGQKLVVYYTRDNIGLVQQIWVLNSEEARQKMPGEDGGGILDAIKSIFVTPEATDNGKRPYDQLPKYKP